MSFFFSQADNAIERHSSFKFYRTRPPTASRPVTQQRPGESVAQFTKRLAKENRDRNKKSIPEVREPFHGPPVKGTSRTENTVRIIDKIENFFKDLRGLDGFFTLPPVLPVDEDEELYWQC